MDFIDIAGNWCHHRDCLLVTASKGDLSTSNSRVCVNPLVLCNVNANDNCCVFEGVVANGSIAICIPSVMVWVEIPVSTISWMESVRGFPTIGHTIKVGIHAPRRCEVGWAKDIGDLVLFIIVHTIFIPITIAVRGVRGVQCFKRVIVGLIKGVRVAKFETVWHSISVCIPIRGTVQKAVTIHVHHEPRAIFVLERCGAAD